MNGFEEGYSFYADSSGASVAAQMGNLWVEEVNAAIDTLRSDLLEFSTSGKTIDTLSGDLAEFWHADTYNIDAILNGSENRAHVPRSTRFASADVELDTGESFQVKYCQDGAHSAKAHAVSYNEASRNPSTSKGATEAIRAGANPNDSVYKGMGRVIPEGQKEDAVRELKRRIAKESLTRKEQVSRLEETREALTDTVGNGDGVKSKSLSREASKELAREVKEGRVDLDTKGISTEQLVKLEHVMKSSLKTGITAATIAMAVKAAPIIVSTIKDAAIEGRIDVDQLLNDGVDTAKTGAGAFLSGTITAALTESMKSGLLGETFKNASSEAVALAVVLAGEGLREGYRLAKGEITQVQFAEIIFRKSYYALIAMGGGHLGQALIPVPVIGYMLGSLAGSLVGGITYEIGSTVFVGLCVNRGMTFFGLVEQDYTIPEDVLKSIGLEVFEYETFEFEKPAFETFAPETLTLESSRLDQFEIRYPRRGLIAFNKIGYI